MISTFDVNIGAELLLSNSFACTCESTQRVPIYKMGRRHWGSLFGAPCVDSRLVHYKPFDVELLAVRVCDISKPKFPVAFRMGSSGVHMVP